MIGNPSGSAKMGKRDGRGRVPIRLVAVGASTGGPKAIQEILSELPSEFPIPIVVVQHISPDFVLPLVEWLRHSAALPIEIAVDGMVARAGHVYVAPGDRHLRVGRRERLSLGQEPAIHACRPSIDPLFHAVADVYGPAAVGVLLTGMGVDGAEGLSRLRARGGRTIVQDEKSAVIFGMPRAAIEKEAAEVVLPLSQIAPTLTRWVMGER